MGLDQSVPDRTERSEGRWIMSFVIGGFDLVMEFDSQSSLKIKNGLHTVSS